MNGEAGYRSVMEALAALSVSDRRRLEMDVFLVGNGFIGVQRSADGTITTKRIDPLEVSIRPSKEHRGVVT